MARLALSSWAIFGGPPELSSMTIILIPVPFGLMRGVSQDETYHATHIAEVIAIYRRILLDAVTSEHLIGYRASAPEFYSIFP
jgi:hypothetical protein